MSKSQLTVVDDAENPTVQAILDEMPEGPRSVDDIMEEVSSDVDEGSVSDSDDSVKDEAQDSEPSDSDGEATQDKKEKKKKSPSSRPSVRIKKLVNEKNDLKTENEDLLNEIKELRKKVDAVQSFQNEDKFNRDQSELDSKIESARQAAREAYNSGDFDTIEKATDELAELKALKNNSSSKSDEFDAEAYFKKRNSWYNNKEEDPEGIMTNVAQRISAEFEEDEEMMKLSREDRLDKVAEETKIRMDRYLDRNTTNELSNVSLPGGTNESLPSSSSNSIKISQEDFNIVRSILQTSIDPKERELAKSKNGVFKFLKDNPDFNKGDQ
jgi:hypothetical protein